MILNREQEIVRSEPVQWVLPDSKTAVKVCFIGAGKMSTLHLDVFNALQGVEIAGVASRRLESAQKIAAIYPNTKAYDNWEKMLEEQKPDAVVVAVAHEVAFDLYAKVLTYGIPCLLEKPAGYSSEQAGQLAEIAEKHGTINMVALNRRFYSNIQQAMLSVMHFGEIRGIAIEAHEKIANYRSRQDFPAWVYDKWLIANSIHVIDLFRFVCGEVEEINTLKSSIREEFGDHFSANLRFKNGIVGTFIAHFDSGSSLRASIFGEGVTAEINPLELGRLTYVTGRTINLEQNDQDIKFRPGIFAQNSFFLYHASRNEPINYPGSDLKDHVMTLKLIEEIAGY